MATVKTPLAGALVVALLLAPRPSSAEPPPAAPGQEPDPAPPAGRSASFSTTVSARRFSESELTSFSQEIVADEARRLPLIDDDLYRSVHLVPGVQADDYSARFSLRGGERDDVVVRLDGVPLFDPFHLQDYGGAISSIDLAAVERSVLYADGFPARYGGRVGGVLDVQTRRAAGEHEIAAGFDLLNAHALALGPLGDGDYLVAARRGYIDLFISAWAPDVAFRPSYWDVFGRVEQPVGARDTVAWYGLVAADDNQILRDAPRPDLSSAYFNAQTWLRWRRPLDGGGACTTAVSYGHARRDRQEGLWGHDVRTVHHAFVEPECRLRLGARAGDLAVGGRLLWGRGDYDMALAGVVDVSRGVAIDRKVDVEIEGWHGAVWLSHDARPFEALRTTLGVRLERVPGLEEWLPAPRASLAWTPHPSLTFRLAHGRYHRAVLPHELPVELGVVGWIPPERAWHRVAGLLWRPGAGLHLRLEAYDRKVDSPLGHLPTLNDELRVTSSPDRASARGVEVEARGYPWLGRVGWLVGYSLARAEEEAEGVAPYPRASDRTHSVTGGLDIGLGGWGRLAAALRWHSGLPFTPVTGLAEPTGADPPGFRFGPPASERLPSFFSVDARWSKDWRFAAWTLRGYLQVVNATLSDNVQEYAWTAEEAAEGWRLVREEQHFFPLLPTLGIEGRF